MKNVTARLLMFLIVLGAASTMSACKQQPDNSPPTAPASQAPSG